MQPAAAPVALAQAVQLAVEVVCSRLRGPKEPRLAVRRTGPPLHPHRPAQRFRKVPMCVVYAWNRLMSSSSSRLCTAQPSTPTWYTRRASRNRPRQRCRALCARRLRRRCNSRCPGLAVQLPCGGRGSPEVCSVRPSSDERPVTPTSQSLMGDWLRDRGPLAARSYLEIARRPVASPHARMQALLWPQRRWRASLPVRCGIASLRRRMRAWRTPRAASASSACRKVRG